MRHKWNKNVEWPGHMPDSVYKIDHCARCGMYCFHKHTYAFFFKTYLISGKEYEKLPACKET